LSGTQPILHHQAGAQIAHSAQDLLLAEIGVQGRENRPQPLCTKEQAQLRQRKFGLDDDPVAFADPHICQSDRIGMGPITALGEAPAGLIQGRGKSLRAKVGSLIKESVKKHGHSYNPYCLFPA